MKDNRITIQGEALALVYSGSSGTYGFDPARPDKTKVGELLYCKPEAYYKEDGSLTGSYDSYVLVGKAKIEVAFFSQAQMKEGAVASLRAEQAKIKAEAHMKHVRLEEKIQSLLAIGMD